MREYIMKFLGTILRLLIATIWIPASLLLLLICELVDYANFRKWLKDGDDLP